MITCLIEGYMKKVSLYEMSNFSEQYTENKYKIKA